MSNFLSTNKAAGDFSSGVPLIYMVVIEMVRWQPDRIQNNLSLQAPWSVNSSWDITRALYTEAACNRQTNI